MQAAWVAFFASALAAWPIYRLLLGLESRQTVSPYAPEGHQAKQGTPTMGGLIVLVGILAGLVFLNAREQTPGLAVVGLLALSFAAIGLLDDFVVPRIRPGVRGLGWKEKLAMQLLAATGALALDPNWRSPGAMAIGVFVVLFYSNAYNFSDGLDGLAGSLGVLLCAGFAVLAPGAAPVALVVAAGLVVFLFLNAPPARVFMGDVGSLPIGAIFGYLALSAVLFPTSLAVDTTALAAIGVLSLVMIVELVPVPLQIFWVKVFKRRLFSYTPIHHAFEKQGWPESRVVWMFVLVQLVLLFTAWSLHSVQGSGR